MDNYQTIIGILEELCPGEEIELSSSLVDDRVLDSLTMVALVAELEDTFDVEVPPVEVVADNFNSPSAIAELVKRLED